MLIQITQKNKKTKHSRTWSFLVQFDDQFKLANAVNTLEFCRYNEANEKGHPGRCYDITHNQYSCSWKTAEPPQKIIDKALKKLIDSWTVVIQKGRS